MKDLSTLANPTTPLDFTLPPALEADTPPEARNLTRDSVRLLVSYQSDDRILHTHFRQLPDLLQEGDLIVINTSGTMNAALAVLPSSDTSRSVLAHSDPTLELHLSTPLPAGLWLVELRERRDKASLPYRCASNGQVLHLPDGATVTLLVPYTRSNGQQSQRLWVASLNLPTSLPDYLSQYGFPIRYSYVQKSWPLAYYQTVYTTQSGSAEMPSAGRAFTPEILTQLIAKGVQVAPLLLHTGVSSLEADEEPLPEYYRIPAPTAHLVTEARRQNKRIIAIGTTVVRALETTTDSSGTTHPGEGWTDLVITPRRGLYAVNALLTGFHEPHASHLLMLEALANRSHLSKTYQQALSEGYLWHEFGDLHLILP